MIVKVMDRLYLSDYGDSTDESVRRLGIHTVITAAHECIPRYKAESDVRHVILPLEDGVPIPKEYFDIALKLIRDRIKTSNVLVHCCSGVSRSATLVLAYLVAIGFSLDEALQLLESKKTNINPNPVLMESLKKYFQQVSGRTY